MSEEIKHEMLRDLGLQEFAYSHAYAPNWINDICDRLIEAGWRKAEEKS